MITQNTTVTKLKYDPWGRKFLVKLPDERNTVWSDDEGDYTVKPPKVVKHKNKDDEKLIYNVSVDDGRFPQIQNKNHLYKGNAIIDSKKNLNESNYFGKGKLTTESSIEKPRSFFLIKMPHVPHHAIEALGNEFLEYLWKDFCDNGANKFGLLKYKYINQIHENLLTVLKENINIFEIDMDEDDYVAFDTVVNKVYNLEST